jgi:hypothetical protein
MSRRVRNFVAVLALSLVLNVPVASAAVVIRDGDVSLRERIMQVLKKVLRPFAPVVNEDDDYKPTPPKP